MREGKRLEKIAIIALAIIAVTMFILPVKATVDHETVYYCERNSGGKMWGVAGVAHLFDQTDAFNNGQNTFYTMVYIGWTNDDEFLEAGPMYLHLDPTPTWAFFVTKKEHDKAAETQIWPGRYAPGNWMTVTICKDKYDATGKSWHVFMQDPDHYIQVDRNFTDSWEGDRCRSTVESEGGITDYAGCENELVSYWDCLSYLTPGEFGNWEYWGSPGYSRAFFQSPGSGYGGDMWLGTVKAPIELNYGSSYYTYVPNISSQHTRYFRSDSWTINGLNGHKFEEETVGSYYGTHYRNMSGTSYKNVTWGMRVWQRNTSGIQDEITVDVDENPVYIQTGAQSGYFNVRLVEFEWKPPLNRVPFYDDDNLVLKLYVKWDNGQWYYADTWVSEQIWNHDNHAIRYIEPSIWLIHWYVEHKIEGTKSCAVFHAGGTTYTSRIEEMDFTYGENEGSLEGISSPPFNPIEMFKKLSG